MSTRLDSEFELVVREGPDTGRVVPFVDDAPIVLGSARDAGLRVSDPTVAGRHASFQCHAHGIEVTDLAPGLSGTFARSLRIRSAIVPVGTAIRAGCTVVEIRRRVAEDLSEILKREGIVYESALMQGVAISIAKMAPFDSVVLIEGETGTGKELAARAFHRLSLRRNGPFVVLDCGALPTSLLESELFGHERGAFTGADRMRPGAFERAHGGTIFLDEIGELPAHQQSALLGVLQRRSLRRVGGQKEIVIDVRIVAATNRDLEHDVESGKFRRDLFFRLAVGRLRLPSLRERPEDVRPLVGYFIEELSGARADLFTAEELAVLEERAWDGNVRELRGIVERALMLGASEVTRASASVSVPRIIGPRPNGEPDEGDPGTTDGATDYQAAKAASLNHFERRFFAELLRRTSGNASEAARFAKMDRGYLLRMLRKHGLRNPG